MQNDLPTDYVLIDKARHEQLDDTMFNPAVDGLETTNRFSERFNNEIISVMELCSDFLRRHGEFGSLERYYEKLPSDWYIDDDFHSVSRVLCIDLLDCRMQTYPIIQGLRAILLKLEFDWMLKAQHDNAYDNRGQFVGESGGYCFWIRTACVEIYSERPQDIAAFYESLRQQR